MALQNNPLQTHGVRQAGSTVGPSRRQGRKPAEKFFAYRFAIQANRALKKKKNEKWWEMLSPGCLSIFPQEALWDCMAWDDVRWIPVPQLSPGRSLARQVPAQISNSFSPCSLSARFSSNAAHRDRSNEGFIGNLQKKIPEFRISQCFVI